MTWDLCSEFYLYSNCRRLLELSNFWEYDSRVIQCRGAHDVDQLLVSPNTVAVIPRKLLPNMVNCFGKRENKFNENYFI